jgi:hypothetical protein
MWDLEMWFHFPHRSESRHLDRNNVVEIFAAGKSRSW